MALSVLAGGYARAGDIPTIDTEQLCNGMEPKTPSGERPDPAAYARWALCPMNERAAFATIRVKWSQISTRITDRCAHVSNSYQSINRCLDAALQDAAPSEVSFYTLHSGNSQVRYWTLYECMEARNGGAGVCVN